MPNTAKHIRGFTLDTRKGNTTHCGKLYYRKINIPFAPKGFQDRKMRLWVPDDFDISKQYGLLFMSDGQNAVDEALTAYGEWNMEDHFQTLFEEGYPEFIIVGIDCPRDGRVRTIEYLPGPSSDMHHRGLNRYYGNKYADYVANEVIPFVKGTFNINEELIGFCGSSMGGLISFYTCFKHPEVFKFSISFSPAFFFFTKEHLLSEFDKRRPNQDVDPRLVFFIGGADKLERRLKINTDIAYKKLKQLGYDEDHLLYLVDESRIHHESTWSDFIEDALRFVLKDYKK